jgi:SAM-dependent methyltransferase
MDYKTRAKKEKTLFNSGAIKRGNFIKYLEHANIFLFRYQMLKDVKKYIAHANQKNILEIGCYRWKSWIDNLGISPRELHCVNISKSEIEHASCLAINSRIKPVFHLMDAHQLGFPDKYFDLVFGSAILHHLDFSIVLPEMSRILKPGGLIIFAEPLDINPFAKFIRYLTPKARTPDEQALRFKELSAIGNFFEVSIISYQLCSVPLSVLSVLLCDDAINPIMKLANFLDKGIQHLIPFLKYYYRYALITGVKKTTPN